MVTDEQLIEAARDIFATLGFELEADSIDPLLSAEIYSHLCAILFPHLQQRLEALLAEDIAESEMLDQIIALLNAELPNVDLSSISGAGIADGDREHIAAFIGLFGELTRSLLEQYEDPADPDATEQADPAVQEDSFQQERNIEEEDEWILPPKASHPHQAKTR